MPRGRPRGSTTKVRPKVTKTLIDRLNQSASELKGSEAGEAAAAGAARIAELEAALRQLERLIVGCF